MAKLLTGTRIYGTGTVDTQLFVSGTNSATSTTTGALQVVGGVGIGGNLYVGGTIFGGTITGTASTATNADNVKTVLSTSTSVFFPVFVDSNNATAGYEAVYSSSTFTIIPSSGNVGVGVATPTEKLHVAGNYVLLKNTADTAAGAVLDSGSTLGQNTQILLRDRGSDKWAIRKNSANDFDIYGSAAGTVALTIFSSTNFIGIGTPTPLSKFVVYGGTVNNTTYTSSEARIADGTLHLMKTSAGGVFEALRAINNDVTAGTTVRLLAAATSDPFNNANGGKVFIDAVRTASNMDLIFSLNDASGAAAVERLRILGSGAIAFNGSTNYGVSGQILQSNGNAAPTWISTGSLAAANATTATHLSGGVAGQIPYQTAPGVTSFVSTGTAGNVLVSNGSSAPTYNNTLTLAGTTNATSTTTGALQVVGGVGVGGDLFIRGDILTNDTTFNLINTNATTVNFAGAATALTMGASGSGTTNVRNNLTVSGNLTVQGTTTIVDSTVTNIADPILTLGGGTGNTAPTADDNKDRGIAFKWVNNGGTTSTGFFGYDDSTGYFTYVQTATITNEVVSGTKGAMDVNLAGGTAMSVVYQSSPNNTAFLAASTSGYILQTNGTGSPPTWVSASGVSAGSATYADNVRTIAQTASASYYPTFVDSNNASNAYELVYTTSSFYINPNTGAVNIGGNLTAPYLYASGGATFNQQVYIDMNGTTFAEAIVMRGGSGTNGGVYMAVQSPSATTGYFGHDKSITGGSTYDLTAYSTAGLGFRVHTGNNATPRLVITANGGVSFGSTSSYGTSGQLLQSNGDAVPTWVNASGLSVGNVNTVLQTSNATYYPAFVDSNNASATAESIYTTSSFTINALSGRVGIGGAVSTAKLHVQGAGAVPSPNATTNSNGLLRLRTADAVYVDIGAYGVSPWTTWMQSGDTGSASYYAMAINPLGGNVSIGTTSTDAKLRVDGQVMINGESNGVAVDTSTAALARVGLMKYSGIQGMLVAGIGTVLRLGHRTDSGYVFTGGTPTIREDLVITSAGGISFNGAGNYGSAGQMLQSNGDAAPTWVALSSRTVGTSTQVNTVLQTASASYFPTFVDSNNAAAAAESLYTTSSFSINPQSGAVSTGGLTVNGVSSLNGRTTVKDTINADTSYPLGIQNGSQQVWWLRAQTTSNKFSLHLNGTGDLVTVDTSGNVGIGTTSPAAKLDLYNTADAGSGANGIRVQRPASYGQYGYLEYLVSSDVTVLGSLYTGGSASTYGQIYFRQHSNGGAIKDTMVISGSNNVGIGTSTPNDKLQVQTQSATAYDPTNDQGQYGSGAGITVTNLDETSQSFAQINLQVSGNAGRAVGRIVAIRTASATSDLAFVTENANTKAEKMRIFSNGNVSIGTTSTTNKFEVAGTAGQLFSVSDSFTGTIFSVNDISGIPSIEVLDTGLVKMAQYNGQIAIGTGTVASSTVTVSIYGMLQTMGTLGEIRASSEITAYFSSDQRLKENIKLIENPITIIDQIRGVTFDWTDEHMARRGGEDGYFVRKHDIGVIAQEVQAVLPELVGTREDGYLAVKYEKMVPLLIEAIKSQQKTIDSLVKDLANVKEFINQLKNNK